MRTVPTFPRAAMYVCLCNGVTEREIRHTAAAGCKSVAELTMRTGCGAGCGSCLATAAEIIDDVHAAVADTGIAHAA